MAFQELSPLSVLPKHLKDTRKLGQQNLGLTLPCLTQAAQKGKAYKFWIGPLHHAVTARRVRAPGPLPVGTHAFLQNSQKHSQDNPFFKTGNLCNETIWKGMRRISCTKIFVCKGWISKATRAQGVVPRDISPWGRVEHPLSKGLP